MFDFNTGMRITDRINLPYSPKAFNIYTSQFLYVEPDTTDFIFKTLSLIDFDTKKEDQRMLNIGSLLLKRIVDVNKKITQNAVIVPKRSVINLLKNLSQSRTSYDQNKNALEKSMIIDYNITAF